MSQLAEALQRRQEAENKLAHLENSLGECERQLKQARLQLGNITDVGDEIDAQARVVAAETVYRRLQAQIEDHRGTVKITSEHVDLLQRQRTVFENTALDCEMALLKWVAANRAQRLRAVSDEIGRLHEEMVEAKAWAVAKLLTDARLTLGAALGDHSMLTDALASAKRGLEKIGE